MKLCSGRSLSKVIDFVINSVCSVFVHGNEEFGRVSCVSLGPASDCMYRSVCTIVVGALWRPICVQ